MAGKTQKFCYQVNGVAIEQRHTDGFINATAMVTAHSKDIAQWFRTKTTLELFCALADELEIPVNSVDLQNSSISRLSASKYVKMFPGLIFSRGGAPETGGGTWLHPDLAMQLAQWCNATFGLQVSKWIRQWLTSAYNPASLEADIERVALRDELKDNRRKAFTDQVKCFLETVGEYNPSSQETKVFFAKVHNELNLVLTGETASHMRSRLSSEIGREVPLPELIRDYFPINDLANYAVLCQAAANNMENSGIHPISAIKLAAKLVLPSTYEPKPIDFVERIKMLRLRIEQGKQQGLLPG